MTAADVTEPKKSRLGDALSGREVQVMELLAEGKSNAEISSCLFVAETTIKSHLARIALKLGTGDRAGMVGVAYRKGLLTVPDSAPPKQPGPVTIQVPADVLDELVAVAAGMAKGSVPIPMLRQAAVRALHRVQAHVRDLRSATRRAA